MVKPSHKKRIAAWAVSVKEMSIRKTCRMLNISERCCRYQPVLNSENEEIADWLLRLTETHKRWGFKLCFLSLRGCEGL